MPRGSLGTERLDRSLLHEWLDELNQRKVNVVLIMDSCYSGEYIQPSNQPLQARRVLLTSAPRGRPATIRLHGDSFSDRFFKYLRLRYDLEDALVKTRVEMQNSRFVNEPQVDADGDGVPNERSDFARLEGLYLGDPTQDTAGDEPEFIRWSPELMLAEGVHEATLEAFVQGGGSVVDIQDLVAVGQHFGESWAAPALNPAVFGPAQRHILYRIQSLLRSANTPESLRLAGRLARSPACPHATAAHLPESRQPRDVDPLQTEPVDVDIRIFDGQGRLVRLLSLGFQPPGSYLDRDAAARWDGRNDAGGPVGNGSYWVVLDAGSVTQVRRLVVVK